MPTTSTIYVGSGSAYFVPSGQTDLNDTVANGGTEAVEQGGISKAAIVYGALNLDVGGVTSNVTYSGDAYGFDSGTTYYTSLTSGTELYVEAGGVAIGTVIGGGAQMNVDYGDAAPPVVSNTVIQNGGSEYLDAGGVLNLAVGAVVSGGIVISGAGNAIISGALGAANSVTFSGTGGTLTLTSGTKTEAFTLVGSYTTSNFALSTDHSGGTIIVDPPIHPDIVVSSGQTHTISAGQTETGDVVNKSGSLYDYGTARGTLVNSGGYLGVQSGGVASNTALDGAMEVYSGGTANSVTLSGSGAELGVIGTVTSAVAGLGTLIEVNNEDSGTGATAYSTVLSGGVMSVTSGALAFNTVVNAFGDLVEGFQGSAYDTVVGGNGEEVLSGGVSYDAVISAGGEQSIATDSIAYDTVIQGGVQLVFGIASGTTDDNGVQSIQSGGAAYGGAVYDTEFVYGGAMTSAVLIGNGGLQDVESAGTASLTTVSGGEEDVQSGGAAYGTVVEAGGLAQVFAGAVFASAIVSSGGTVVLNSGAAIYTDTVKSGGVADITSAASAYLTYMSRGAVLDVGYGGIASASEVFGYQAVQTVESGGAAYATYVSGAATFETVEAGGATQSAEVVAGGQENILSGASAYGILIGKGGLETVYAGGTDNLAIVSARQLLSGGTATNALVQGGGSQIVKSGGAASATTVGSNGSQTVSNGGKSIATSALSGGMIVVSSGGKTVSGTLRNSGTEVVSSGGIISAAVVSSGGVLKLLSGAVVSGGIVISGAGTVVISGTLGASNSITFSGAGGELQVASGGSCAAPIKGFTGTTDKIDVGGFAYSSATESVAFAPAGGGTSGTLTLTSGTKTEKFTLVGSYTTSNFALSTDNSGGTIIVDPPVHDAADNVSVETPAVMPAVMAFLPSSAAAPTAGGVAHPLPAPWLALAGHCAPCPAITPSLPHTATLPGSVNMALLTVPHGGFAAGLLLHGVG